MKNKLDIKFVDEECVEISLEESVFRLAIDEHGLPEFPESLKEKLPPYLPEMVERWIKSKRHNPNQGLPYMAVSHELRCPEMKGTGRCNCNPVICDLEIREYSGIGAGKLTCKVCDESSIGEVILYDLVEDDTGCWERFWIEGGDMFYWLVGIAGTEIRLLICHLCMIDLGIKFPNALECDKDDKDSGGYQH
jgi:hypothetical protein